MIPVQWLDVERDQSPGGTTPVLGLTEDWIYCICFWDPRSKRLVWPEHPWQQVRYWIDLPEPPHRD